MDELFLWRGCERLVGQIQREDGFTRKPRWVMKEGFLPRQMGSIAMPKGLCLELISVLLEAERVAVSTKQKKRGWDETFEDGTWTTCRHAPYITAKEGLI